MGMSYGMPTTCPFMTRRVDEGRKDVVEIIVRVGQFLLGQQLFHRHRVVDEAAYPGLIQVEDIVRARLPRGVRAHLGQDAIERQ